MTAPTEVRSCRACGVTDPSVMVRRSDHPTGLATICRPCDRVRARARYVANPEAEREAARAHYAANADRLRAAQRARVAADRETHRAMNRATTDRYAARTPAEVAATRARLRPDGLKRCRACRECLPFDAFRLNRRTPDGLSQSCRPCLTVADAARHRRTALAGWQALGLDPDFCVYCGAEAEHADHVWPRHLDGPDDRSNLVPACSECNLSKGATPLVWWLPRRFPTAWPEILDRLLAVEGLDVVSPATRLDLAA